MKLVRDHEQSSEAKSATSHHTDYKKLHALNAIMISRETKKKHVKLISYSSVMAWGIGKLKAWMLRVNHTIT